MKGEKIMGFFKKRKAKKLAEEQEKRAIEQKKADALKEAQVKTEPKVEVIKQAPAKPAPVVAKENKQVKPAKKDVPSAKKDEKPVLKTEKLESKAAKYHVSQNKDPKSDNHRKWRVRKEGSEKTIKFFETQKEAIEYADGLAQAVGSSVVIHKLDGSIRKQVYKK